MTSRLPSVVIVRRIKAPPAKVWAAITQPDLMLQWWGPDAGPTLSVVADVRPGGRFSVVFRLLNGDEHNPTGIYREVVPGKKLTGPRHRPAPLLCGQHPAGGRRLAPAAPPA